MINHIAIVCLLAAFCFSYAQECTWDRQVDFPAKNPPLLLNKKKWTSHKPVLQKGKRVVREKEGESVVVVCSGSKIKLLDVEVAEGYCSGGNIIIDGQPYTPLDLACSSRIKDSVMGDLGNCGDGGIGTVTKIGFEVPGYKFYPIIEVCFETESQRALYAQNKIHGKSVSGKDRNPSRPTFQRDRRLFPSVDPNKCYSTAGQDDYLTQITGDPDVIDKDTNKYFARGHLAPNADFLIEAEADATFYYGNAVPQWQPYNAGNWEALESNSRELAKDHQVELVVTSGPLGILTVDDINGDPTEVFICDSTSARVIPVPKAMWKVIYDPVKDQGIAVITSNVPNEVTAPKPVCKTVNCSKITWLMARKDFEPKSFEKGFTYCCTVQAFNKAHPHAPPYPSAELLIN